MDDLFSHPFRDQPEQPNSEPELIESLGVREIPLSLVDAVSGFVEHLHLWWPDDLREDEESSVELSGSDVVEVFGDGTTHRLARLEQIYDAGTESLLLSLVFDDPTQCDPLTVGWAMAEDVEGGGSRLSAGARGEARHPADGDPIEREDLLDLVESYGRFVNATPSSEPR